jgi:hypothetical protein
MCRRRRLGRRGTWLIGVWQSDMTPAEVSKKHSSRIKN